MIQFIKPSFEILHMPDMLKTIELAGRVCYKSEDRITEDSAADFCEMILNRGHESVIEHAVATVRFICDRGVTHELVRHRLASFSQESTRYCNYGGGVTFIIPPWVSIPEGDKDEIPTNGLDYPSVLWLNAMNSAGIFYSHLLTEGWSPQQARAVLPNSLKTEIVVTANMREWRHIFKLRTSKAAHPQMREIMVPLLQEMDRRCPVLFDDITV